MATSVDPASLQLVADVDGFDQSIANLAARVVINATKIDRAFEKVLDGIAKLQPASDAAVAAVGKIVDALGQANAGMTKMAASVEAMAGKQATAAEKAAERQTAAAQKAADKEAKESQKASDAAVKAAEKLAAAAAKAAERQEKEAARAAAAAEKAAEREAAAAERAAAAAEKAEAKKKAAQDLARFKQEENMLKLVEKAYNQGGNQLEKLLDLRQKLVTMTSNDIKETDKYAMALERLDTKINEVSDQMAKNKGRRLSTLFDEQNEKLQGMLAPMQGMVEKMDMLNGLVALFSGNADKMGESTSAAAESGWDMAQQYAESGEQLRLVDGNAQETTSSLSKLDIAAAGLIAVTVALAAAGIKAAGAFADQTLEIDKAAKFAGIATESLSRYQVLAQKTGMDVSELGEVFAELANKQSELNKGNEDLEQAFKALGITTSDLNGKLRDPEERLKAIAEGFARAGDRGQATTAIMAIFGDDLAKKLAPALSQGRDGLEAMLRKNDELGLFLGTDGVNAARKYKETMAELDARVQGLTQTFGQFAAEVVNANLEAFDVTAALKYYGVLKDQAEVPVQMVSANMAKLRAEASRVAAELARLENLRVFKGSTPELEQQIVLLTKRRNMIAEQISGEKGLSGVSSDASKKDVDARKAQAEAIEKQKQAVLQATSDTLEGRKRLEASYRAEIAAIRQEEAEAKAAGAHTAELAELFAQRRGLAEKKLHKELRELEKETAQKRQESINSVVDAVRSFAESSLSEEDKLAAKRAELLARVDKLEKDGLVKATEAASMRAQVNAAADAEIAASRKKSAEQVAEAEKKAIEAAQAAQKERVAAFEKASQDIAQISSSAVSDQLDGYDRIAQGAAESQAKLAAILDKQPELFGKVQDAMTKVQARAERDRQKLAMQTAEQTLDLAKGVISEVQKLTEQWEQDKVDLAQETADELASIEEELADLEQKVRDGKATASERARMEELKGHEKAKQAQLEAEKAAAIKAFNINKALSLVQVAIDGAQAIMKAIAMFGPPPSPMGMAGIAAAGTITAIQAALIATQKPPSFHTGGIVRDGLTPAGKGPDEVLALVRKKEGILTAQGVRDVGGEPGVRALNRGAGAGMAGGNLTVNLKVGRKTTDRVNLTGLRPGGPTSKAVRQMTGIRSGHRR